MWTRRFQTSHFLALLASGAGASSKRTHRSFSTAAFSSPAFHRRSFNNPQVSQAVPLNPPSVSGRKSNTQQNMSFFGGPADAGGIKRIDRAAMTEIIEDVANSNREESGYVIIDVRGHDEVQYTGKLNDVVETLPLPYIAQGALAMEDEDFKEEFGFDKPALDETIVFSCKAGIRSYQAAQLAQMGGYSDVLEYKGGSNEWFS